MPATTLTQPRPLPSLEARIESPLLFTHPDGAPGFLHDTYRDFFLARESQRRIKSGELSLLDFYERFFELLGGFGKWKNLSEFILEMVEDNFTPPLAKAVRDDPDLGKISTIEQFLPNGAASKTFIQINDYYCTYQAQKVIMEMEKILIERYNINLILREGLSGKLDVSAFAEFPDKEIKAQVCDYFMKQGKITADEALAITTDLNFISWGVEDQQLFKQSHTSKSAGEGYDVLGKVESNVKRIFVGLALHNMPEAVFVYGSSFNDWFTKNILSNGCSYLRLNPLFEGGKRDEETYQKVLRGEQTPLEQFLGELGRRK